MQMVKQEIKRQHEQGIKDQKVRELEVKGEVLGQRGQDLSWRINR